MNGHRRHTDLPRILTVLAIAVIVVVVLYLASTVLIPLALALLLTFVLVPMVSFFERRVRLGRIPAVILTTLAAFTPIVLVSWIVAGERVSPWENIQTTLTPLLGFLAGAGIVVVFVVFMLIQHEDLRDRVVRLLGRGRRSVTTQAISEAAERVGLYLRTALLLNVAFGVVVALGLFLIGVPNAILWGALAIPLRFIPVLGPIVAASLPVVVAFAVFDSWSAPLMTLGLFVGLEMLSEYVFEPWLYGARTGVSTLAILVSVLFWGSLWGPAGLVLATPLTVCLVVLGRYTTDMRFLTVLLSDEPGLAPEARLYHRLLSMDQESAYALAQQYLNEHSLGDLYGKLLMPALAMAEEDRHRGALDAERMQFVMQSISDLVEELGEQARAARLEAQSPDEGTKKEEPAAKALAAAPVLCLPARDEADELAAQMLAQLMELDGVRAEAVPVSALAGEMLDVVEQRQATMVCVSAMPPLAIRHARYLVKRLVTKLPKLSVIVGLWGVGDIDQARRRMQLPGVTAVVTILDGALLLASQQARRC